MRLFDEFSEVGESSSSNSTQWTFFIISSLQQFVNITSIITCFKFSKLCQIFSSAASKGALSMTIWTKVLELALLLTKLLLTPQTGRMWETVADN